MLVASKHPLEQIRHLSPVASWRCRHFIINSGSSWLTLADEKGLFLRISGPAMLSRLRNFIASAVVKLPGGSFMLTAGQATLIHSHGTSVFSLFSADDQTVFTVAGHIVLSLKGRSRPISIAVLDELRRWLDLLVGSYDSLPLLADPGGSEIIISGRNKVGRACSITISPSVAKELQGALLAAAASTETKLVKIAAAGRHGIKIKRDQGFKDMTLGFGVWGDWWFATCLGVADAIYLAAQLQELQAGCGPKKRALCR